MTDPNDMDGQGTGGSHGGDANGAHGGSAGGAQGGSASGGATFADEELVAYLDGEHEFARVAAIEARAAVDARLAARLDALRLDRDALVRGFEALLPHDRVRPPLLGSDRDAGDGHGDDAIERGGRGGNVERVEGAPPGSARAPSPALAPAGAPVPANDAGRPLANWRLLAPMAASVVLAVGLALGLGALLARDGAPDADGGSLMAGEAGWREYVAAYQALYTNATLASVEEDEAARRSELARVGAAIGLDLPLEALDASPAVTFKRAQLLGFEGRPLAQLAFLGGTGDPIALCIIRSGGNGAGEAGGAASPVEVATMEGLSTASWSRGGFEYLLIGGTDEALIAGLAEGFASGTL